MSFILKRWTNHHSRESLHNVIRLSTGLCLLGLFLWQDADSSSSLLTNPNILTVVGYIILSTTILLFTRQNTIPKAYLHSATIFIDILALSLLLIFGEETTAPLCIIYYLLLLNNGLHRYPRGFWLSASLSILGFSSVLYMSSFWYSQIYIGTGLLLGIILMTLLISRRLHNSNNTIGTAAPDSNSTQNGEIPLRNTEVHIKQKLLLITHDSTDRHMLLNYITSWEIEVQICNSAIRAFAELLNAADKGTGYSTIIVDSLNLEMDPGQFSRSLRSDDSLRAIHLIHISPGENSGHETQLIDAGYSRVLNTPLDKTILFNALHTTEQKPWEGNNVTQLINYYSNKESSRQPVDILLATPDLIEQDSFRSILEQDGQRVYSVDSGSQTLDALNTHQFDLAIIDFKMPDMDAKDVIRLYYYTNLNQDWVPFITLVDKATPEILSLCREAEVDAILVRPIQKQKLLSTVADVSTAKAKRADNIDNQINPIHSHDSQIKDNRRQVLNIPTLRQLEHLSSNNDFLEQLISNFNGDMSQLLDGIAQAIDNNLFTEFQDLSHALRDSSCNMGANLLYRVSLQALQINQHEFRKQAPLILDELHIAQSKTKYALHNYVEQRDNSATDKE